LYIFYILNINFIKQKTMNGEVLIYVVSICSSIRINNEFLLGITADDQTILFEMFSSYIWDLKT
jgi:hypothetical protein